MTRWLILLLALVCSQAWGATLYCSPSGGGSGADFNNLCTLPDTTGFTRGNVYIIVEGSYGSKALTTAASGSDTITIKKASAADSGVTGYSSTLHDAQAVFGDITINSAYWTIDGTTRNESDWNDHAAYGMQITSVRSSRLDYSGPCSTFQCECQADNITVRYAHIGTESLDYASSTGGQAFYLGGFGSGAVACEDWTLERLNIRNVFLAVQCAGCFGLLYQYNFHDTGWAKESIRGNGNTGTTSNMTVRWSVFKDSCQKDPEDPTSGCTAEIASWSGAAGTVDNVEIYGNVFYKTTTEINSGGVIVLGGNGGSWSGSPANNAKVYNNTIAGIDDWHAEILINGGTGNECRNNLWYDNVGSIDGCNGGTTSNNEVAGANPFVNYAGGNFRLSGAKGPGTSLGSPYNVDMDGVTRGADGTWDRGAFEFDEGGAGAPDAPTGLRIIGLQ